MHKLALLLAASISCSSLFAADNNEIWGTYQGSSAHTGYSNTTVNVGAIQPLWSREIAVPQNTMIALGQPIVTKDSIYFHTTSYMNGSTTVLPDTLLALNAANGETRWQNAFDLTMKSSAITYADNKIYVMLLRNAHVQQQLTSDNIEIAAYDAGNGNNIFAVSAQLSNGTDDWMNQAPVVDHHQLFLGTYGMQLAANADNGQLQWRSGDVRGSDNIAVANSDYVVRYMRNALSLLSRKTGKLVRTIESADREDWDESVPLVLNEQQNIVYAVFDNRDYTRQVTAIDLTKNQVLWKLDVPAFVRQPAYANGMLYFIQRDLKNYDSSTLYAVDANSGTIMWTMPFAVNVDSNLIVTNNAIFLAVDGKLNVISLETHQIVKTIKIRGNGYYAIANNTLYFTEIHAARNEPETVFVSAYALN